jgi:hypothetical protein
MSNGTAETHSSWTKPSGGNWFDPANRGFRASSVYDAIGKSNAWKEQSEKNGLNMPFAQGFGGKGGSFTKTGGNSGIWQPPGSEYQIMHSPQQSGGGGLGGLIGSGLGFVAGNLIAPGVGGKIGATIGGQVGGSFG